MIEVFNFSNILWIYTRSLKKSSKLSFLRMQESILPMEILDSRLYDNDKIEGLLIISIQLLDNKIQILYNNYEMLFFYVLIFSKAYKNSKSNFKPIYSINNRYIKKVFTNINPYKYFIHTNTLIVKHLMMVRQVAL